MTTFNIDMDFPALEKELKLGGDDREILCIMLEQYANAKEYHAIVKKNEKEAAEKKLDKLRGTFLKHIQRLVYTKAYFMCCEARKLESDNMYQDSLTGDKWGNEKMMPEICEKLGKLWKDK